MNQLYLDILSSYVSCHLERLEKMPSLSAEEIKGFFDFCQKQGILGIGLLAIDALISKSHTSIKNELLYNWIGLVRQIQVQNELVDYRCVELSHYFNDNNIRYCILKGQGNARMYPDRRYRTPGDIDVWLEGKKEDVVSFVHRRFPDINVQYHHMDFPIFTDIEVEVHYFPSFCYNKINNKRLQHYFRESADTQFRNSIQWDKDGNVVCIPTTAFNLVFQLSHIMRHFFTQGIGLRHLLDYYYLLERDISESEKKEALYIIKKTGMYRFLMAIMWIEVDVLKLNQNTDFAASDKKAGRRVLHEILKGGNFGRYYQRKNTWVLGHYAEEMIYNLRYISLSPSECLSRPFTLILDYFNKHILNRNFDSCN